MAKGSRTSNTKNDVLPHGNSSATVRDVGKIPAKSNPSKPFHHYVNDFAKTRNIDELRKVLSKNGVEISDRLVKYVNKGDIEFDTIKRFFHGALQTMSTYGNLQEFSGFGAFKSARSSTMAYYNHPADIGTQGTGHIALNVSLINKHNAKSTGAHEAFHQVTAHRADKSNMDSLLYADKIYTKSYKSWKRKNKHKDIVSDTKKHISNYGATNSSEALSEAMANITKSRNKASRLSRTAISNVSYDITHSRVKGKQYKINK